MARGPFYYWQPRFETGGYAALEQCQSHAAKEPTRTAPDIERRVIDLRRQNSKWGKRRIALEDLQIDRLAVIYPGDRRYPLADRVTAIPLQTLAGAEPSMIFPS